MTVLTFYKFSHKWLDGSDNKTKISIDNNNNKTSDKVYMNGEKNTQEDHQDLCGINFFIGQSKDSKRSFYESLGDLASHSQKKVK